MIRISRIKLQWGASRVTPGDWYLGLFGIYARRTGRGQGLALSLRGVLAWGLVAGVAAYLAGGGYYWWKQNQRPYNYVTYPDVLLYPLSAQKRAEVRALQGKSMIAEGMDALEAQQWNRALMSLRIGLDRYPRDLTARLKLAQLFLAYRVRTKAQETLMHGLDHDWPGRAYLQSAIEVASAGEDYEIVLKICDRALSLHDPARHAAADRRWLVEQRVRALLAEKRNDEAFAFAELHAAALDEKMLSELRLLALLQSGRPAEAVAFAEQWRARSGEDSQVLRLLARAYREAGRLDDMAGVLARIRADAPADPRAHVYALIQLLMAGREAEGRALLEDYVFRFGGTDAHYAMAAEPLAEINRPDELEVLMAAATERGIRDPRLLAARLQALIAGRRWSEAARQLADLRASLPREAAGRAGLLDLLQYLIAAAADPADGAQSSLTDHVRSRQLPMSAYRQCVDVLRKAGRLETARRIVNFAEGVYPNNRYLAETRSALEAELAARVAAEEAARPVAAPVAAFASRESFAAGLDEAVAEQGPAAGLALLREVRKTRAAWVAEAGEWLARRELELHAEGEDMAGLQGAARRYLTTERAKAQAVIAVATRLHEAKRDPEARMLLTEILRRTPGEPAAAGLLARWFPPKPAGPGATVPAK